MAWRGGTSCQFVTSGRPRRSQNPLAAFAAADDERDVCGDDRLTGAAAAGGSDVTRLLWALRWSGRTDQPDKSVLRVRSVAGVVAFGRSRSRETSTKRNHRQKRDKDLAPLSGVGQKFRCQTFDRPWGTVECENEITSDLIVTKF